MPINAPPPTENAPPLAARRVHLVGRFGAASRRAVEAAVRRSGATLDALTPDLVVIGENAGPDARTLGARVAPGVEVIDESELWRRLGLLDTPDHCAAPRGVLHTPSMLAELVGAPIQAIKRWRRRGLLRPRLTVNRLDFFDFDEARAAKTLARLLDSGLSLPDIEKQAERLAARHPHVDRPLVSLPVSVDHGVVVVDPTRPTEASGQRRLLFEPAGAEQGEEPAVLEWRERAPSAPATLRERAWRCFDDGDLGRAIALWRSALAESPPSADDHFVLAEWLQMAGQAEAARERLHAALELDDEHPEARLALAEADGGPAAGAPNGPPRVAPASCPPGGEPS
ncbi:MerR family transcriptional regulator [Botrimarina sp.]|uniref:MerR family transcriptional regulator n=1 Tax=Botrimarina sp. TaxID=2795802 RepID=UPI0032EBE502